MSNDINIGVAVNTQTAKQQLQNLAREFKSLGDAVQGTRLGDFTSGLGDMGSKLKMLATPMGAAVAGVGLLAVGVVGLSVAIAKNVKDNSALANSIKQISDATDISVTSISQLSTMIVRGGGEIGDTSDIIKDFTDKLGDARLQAGGMRDSFKSLGVDLKGSNSKALEQTITALGKMSDKAKATNIGMQLFGDNYTKIAAEIAKGNKLVNQTPMFSDEYIISSQQLTDNIKSMGVEFQVATNDGLTPFVTALANISSDLMNSQMFDDFINAINDIGRAFSAVMTTVSDITKGFAIGELEKAQTKLENMMRVGNDLTDEINRYQEIYNRNKDEGTAATIRELKARRESLALAYLELEAKNKAEYNRLYGPGYVAPKRTKTSGNTVNDVPVNEKVVNLIDILTGYISNLNLQISINTKIIPVWRDKISIIGQLAELTGSNILNFGEDFVKANQTMNKNNTFFKFIGKTADDFKKYTEFLATGAQTIPEDVKEIVKAYNVFGADIGQTWAQVGKGITGVFEKFNISSIQNNPILKIIDNIKEKVKTTESELQPLYAKYVELLASKKDTKDVEAQIKRQEDIIGNYKRAYNETLGLYDQKAELIKLFNENPLLLSDKGLEYLTSTSIVPGSNETVLQNLKVFLKGTTEEVITLIKSTADQMNKELAERFKPENIARSFADYEEATKMIASMKISNMSGDKISERKAKAEAEANAEYEAMIDGYLQMEIGQAEYFALAEQAEIAHNERLKEIRETSANDYIQSIVNNGEMLKTAVFGITDEIANGRRQAGERALVDMQTRHTKELESAKLSARGMRALEAKQAAEIQAEKDKQAEAQYKADIASLWINSFINQGKAFAGAVGQFGFPAGPIIGGGLATAILVQTGIAQSNAKKHKGYEDGGIVPGNSMRGDNVPVNVNSREMILTQSQQKVLFDMANGRAQANSNQGNISVNIENFSGSDNELSKLEDMLLTLQNKNRIRGVIA